MDQEILHLLRTHRTVSRVPPAELEWIAAHGRLLRFPAGEIVSRHTEPVSALYIVISGRLSITVHRPTGPRRMMEWRAGDISGTLPYSRMVNPPGDTITEEATEVVAIAREDLPDLARSCYELTSILVHEMTDRARHFTVTDLRDEKLTSLGKLAAGLAHELNNPASALIRDAKSLGEHFAMAYEAARVLWNAGLDRERLASLDEFLQTMAGTPPGGTGSALDTVDREDFCEAWLTAHGIDGALAPDLARTSATAGALDRLADSLHGPFLDAAIRWVVAAEGARSLVLNVERAASRIHGLVGAVKGFTHMDRAAADGPIDITRGLADTLALLNGKARDKSVTVDLDVPPGLPRVVGRAAEINQVWMNLLDNAIHAARERGRVEVRAAANGHSLTISVVDDGPGIPPDIAGHVFDPFFTTKDVGVGTGLGLDIVRRIVQSHGGEIDFTSRPGRTEFRVRLPVAEQTRSPNGPPGADRGDAEG